MLNIVCGSINPDSGKILIEGQDITKEKEYRRLLMKIFGGCAVTAFNMVLKVF